MATTFTPYASLIGVVLIGFSAIILMLFLGRIAGVTGILAGMLLPGSPADWLWRAAFIAGMIAAPTIATMANIPTQPIQVPVEAPAIAVGCAIVGVGVTLGAGCTSGHGVCGLARLSARSLTATLIFMATTAITVYVIRHIVGG